MASVQPTDTRARTTWEEAGPGRRGLPMEPRSRVRRADLETRDHGLGPRTVEQSDSFRAPSDLDPATVRFDGPSAVGIKFAAWGTSSKTKLPGTKAGPRSCTALARWPSGVAVSAWHRACARDLCLVGQFAGCATVTASLIRHQALVWGLCPASLATRRRVNVSFTAPRRCDRRPEDP